MKAAQLVEFGNPLEIRDINRPEPGPHEVLVETKSAGICKSDVGIRSGGLPTADVPFTMGHEPMGIIASMGSEVNDVSAGTRVSVNPMVTCGKCFYCLRGEDDNCERWRRGEGKYGSIGRHSDGAFAEYFTAPADRVVELPSGVSDAVGSISMDACSTSFNAISRAPIEYGDTVVVYGAGGLGSCALKYLSKMTHLTKIAIDVKEPALERARNLGVVETVNPSERDPVSAISEVTEQGADVAFDFTGNSTAIESAVKSIRPGGTTVITGCAEQPWEVPRAKMCLEAPNVLGNHGWKQWQLERVVELIDEGIVEFDDLITHEFSLSEVNSAIDLLEDPSLTDEEVGRMVITTFDE